MQFDQYYISQNFISIIMSQKGQKFNDLTTQHTDNSSIAQRLQLNQQPIFLNKIIESTQQIINSQAMQIFELNNQLKSFKKQNQTIKLKYQTLIKTCNTNSSLNLDDLLLKINQLQNQLISTKMQLAQCKAQNLQLKFQGMKNQKGMSISNTLQSIKSTQIEKLKLVLKEKSVIQKTSQNLNSTEWNKLVDQYLLGFPRVGRFKQKSFDLIKKGIPHSLRQTLWPIIFQNKVGITNNLYSQLLNKKQKYDKQNNFTKKVLSQIDKDICRSFNGKTQFDSKIGLCAQVTEVLQMFHIYRPDVSYVQGMTYPVIVLNLIVGKYKAFWIFCNVILGNDFFRRLYTFQPHYLSCYCRTFDILLQQRLPKMSKFLAEKQIQSQIFLVEWFYTFFSRGFSYQFTLKIWDLLAYEAQLLFYKLGLCIFQLLQNRLLQSQVEEPITIIRQFSSYLTETKLQQTLFSHKLTVQKLEKTFEKVFKKQERSI